MVPPACRIGPTRDCPGSLGRDCGTDAATRERRGRASRISPARWATLASPTHPVRPGLDRPARRRCCAGSRRPAATSSSGRCVARVLGGELLRSGLCGEWSGPRHPAEDVLPATLGLLRDRLPQVFGLPGCCAHAARRSVLDEMAAGYAGALRDRVRREQEEDLRRQVAHAVAQDALTLLPQPRGRGAAPAPRLRLLRRGLPRPVLAGPRRVRRRERHARPRPRRPAAGRGRRPGCTRSPRRTWSPATGGDEFAVLVECVVDPRAVESLARRIQEALTLPFRVGGRVVEISVSVGVAVASPGHGRARRPPPGGGRRAVVGEGAGQRAGRGVRPRPRRRRVGPGGAARRAARRGGARRVPAALPAARAPAPTAGCAVPRRWCAGSTPSTGCSARAGSSRRRSAAAPSCRWAAGSSPRRAGRPPPGGASWGPRAPYVSVNVSPGPAGRARLGVTRSRT